MPAVSQDVFIAAAARTPIASFRGSFAPLTSVDLGAVAGSEALRRAGVAPAEVEETICGSVLTASQGQNVGRQVALKIGIPEDRQAFTVNKVCSSGLKALILATQAVQLGYRDTVLVVGTESMSNSPFFLNRGDHGYGEIKLVDSIQRDGISDAILNDPMGLCAEKSAKEYKCSRQEQDAFAIESYARAAANWANGDYAAEVVPVEVKQKKGSVLVKEDEEFKRLIKEKVPTLAPAFLRDGSGTITAANASSLNDGAASLVVVSGPKSKSVKAVAKVVAYAEAGRAPVDFTVAPINAVERLLAEAKVSKEQVSLWEVNEAFSVTALAFIKHFGLNPASVNARGGAVALGHPIGMSGARIVVALVHQLKPGQLGVAAICNGGGEATAILIKKL